jgi:toxin ParE1/3/4
MPKAARRIVWAPKSKQDLLNVWRYFAHVASPEIADKLLHEIRLAAERLGERPLLGRPREEVLPGLRSVRVHPYAVFYRVTDASVEVVRVLHERRNFPAALTKDER